MNESLKFKLKSQSLNSIGLGIIVKEGSNLRLRSLSCLRGRNSGKHLGDFVGILRLRLGRAYRTLHSVQDQATLALDF